MQIILQSHDHKKRRRPEGKLEYCLLIIIIQSFQLNHLQCRSRTNIQRNTYGRRKTVSITLASTATGPQLPSRASDAVLRCSFCFISASRSIRCGGYSYQRKVLFTTLMLILAWRERERMVGSNVFWKWMEMVEGLLFNELFRGRREAEENHRGESSLGHSLPLYDSRPPYDLKRIYGCYLQSLQSIA